MEGNYNHFLQSVWVMVTSPKLQLVSSVFNELKAQMHFLSSEIAWNKLQIKIVMFFYSVVNIGFLDALSRWLCCSSWL